MGIDVRLVSDDRFSISIDETTTPAPNAAIEAAVADVAAGSPTWDSTSALPPHPIEARPT